MSGKRIKNDDIKNFLKDKNKDINTNEKKYYSFEPILNKINEMNKNNIDQNNIENKIKDKKNKNTIIKKNENLNNNILIKSKTSHNTPKGNNIYNYMNKFKTNNIKNNKLKLHQPFVTSLNVKNIQTSEEESKILSSKYKSKKNNLVSFGKSLNEILINNINEAIMKKGNIIKKKKRKNFSANIYSHNIKNFNNYDIHMKIFDDKLIQIFDDFEKRQKLYKKQRLNYLLPELEERRKKVISRIPLSIKGYKKNEIDIIYTRNVCDLDYQKYYMKDKINMNEILENHNIYNRKDYLSGKVPFFMLTKSVIKPNCKKSISQKNIFSNEIKEISI